MLKKFIAHTLVFSLVFNNLAFATNAIIELDFKDSQTPQRLHTILPSYKIADVSHIEIDTEKRQACVYRIDPPNYPKTDKTPLVFILKRLRRILLLSLPTIFRIFPGN